MTNDFDNNFFYNSKKAPSSKKNEKYVLTLKLNIERNNRVDTFFLVVQLSLSLKMFSFDRFGWIIFKLEVSGSFAF